MIVLEWMSYLWEWMHFILRNSRDVQLGQRANWVMFAYGKRASWAPAMARRYIAMMTDLDSRDRHEAAIIRAGH